MSLDVGTAATEAVERLTTSAAGALGALFVVTGLVQALATSDLLVWSLERLYELVEEADPEAATEIEADVQDAIAQRPPGLGLDVVPAFGLWIVALVVGLAGLALAIDAFGREVDEASAVGTTHFGWKTVNLTFGAIVYGLLVTIGSLLFLPGIVFAVVLLYFPVAVVVDEDWFGAAFVSSMEVVGDNLLQTLGVLLLIVLSYGSGLLVGSVLALAVPGPLGFALQQVVGAVLWLFTIALLTRAYVGATGATVRHDTDIVDDDWDTEV